MVILLLLTLAAVNMPQLYGLQNKTVVIEQKTSSVLGKYLKGHVFKVTSKAENPQHCLADCWEENDRCQSFNFFPELAICELNDASNLTSPQNLIDKPNVVYLTNPVYGREKRLQMPRHEGQLPVTPIDPCASNPCVHSAHCVKDENLGYRCEQCDSGYYGPKCEEYMDPCSSNPCQPFGATCVSNMTLWKCTECPFPLYGSYCEHVSKSYQFDLDGTGNYPFYSLHKRPFRVLFFNFWFKTEEKNVSYLIHGTPISTTPEERLIVWLKNRTFYVELWKDSVHNFTFPTSYPLTDNTWHLVAVSLDADAMLSLYLDGVMRHTPKRTKGIPGSNALYVWQKGIMRLGYFKDSNGKDYFFKGSIANFDMTQRSLTYGLVRDTMLFHCVPTFRAWLSFAKWARLTELARPVNCSLRVSIKGISTYSFPIDGRTLSRWLEHQVSPPRRLTAFTIIFQMKCGFFPPNPYQIACYGDQGVPCRLSVVIHKNLTLETTIASTRLSVDLLPVFNAERNSMILTWTNEGGVFELMINGVLQSRILNIENNGQIPAQSRFIVGGSDVADRNFYGVINNFNVWDKVLPRDMLYFMSAQPGNDMGNVVAWKDLKKPQQLFPIYLHIDGWFHHNPVGKFDNFLEFNEGQAYLRSHGCCDIKRAITLAMWIKLSIYPARMFMFQRNQTEDMVLQVDRNGKIVLSMDDSNPVDASLGFIPVNSGYWNFVAISWSDSGDLHSNINGKHNHTSNFKQNFGLDMSDGGTWIIGGLKNNSLVGKVAHVNLWFEVLPPPVLMALSRGISFVYASSGNGWTAFLLKNRHVGNVNKVKGVPYYLPDIVTQSKRDELCDRLNSLEECNKYYARCGMENTQGRKFACFCEDQLSKDMNFNYGLGNYTNHESIMNITQT